MSKHTPGPWVLTQNNNCFPDFVVKMADSDYRRAGYIAEVRAFTNQTEVLANAYLIAAAPDLLDALQSMEMALTGYTRQNDITINALAKCRAALAKATGATP